MDCGICNKKDIKNCFQAGHSKPICEACFFINENNSRLYVTYKTRTMKIQEIDDIFYKLLDENIETGVIKDIYFDDDDTAIFVIQLTNKVENLSDFVADADRGITSIVRKHCGVDNFLGKYERCLLRVA